MSEKEINELIQTGELAKVDPAAEPIKEPEVSEELLEAAEAHADQQLEELKEEQKRRKKMLIKFGAMGLLSVVIMVFATIAWFSMSREVSAGSMAITTATSPFELKTKGYYGYYDDYLDEGVEKIADDLETAGLPPSGTNSELTTNGNTIQWLITDTYNAKNYVTSSTKDDDKGIRPGTSGEMKFWVVSKGSRTINICFRLTVSPFKTNYILDESGNYVFSEGATTPDESTPISIATDDDYTDVRNYLFSHILFFKKRTLVEPASGSSYYTYSDLISLDEDFNLVYDSVNNIYTSTLTFDVDEGDVLQDKPLSIYWVWPETLAEAVLPENSQETGHHAVCTGDEIINKLKANPSYFLKDYNAASDTGNTANADLTKEIIKQYYPRLSLEYNNADQEIGDNVGYILLSLAAM